MLCIKIHKGQKNKSFTLLYDLGTYIHCKQYKTIKKYTAFQCLQNGIVKDNQSTQSNGKRKASLIATFSNVYLYHF